MKDEELEPLSGLAELKSPSKYHLLSEVLVEELTECRFTVYGGLFYLSIEAPHSYGVSHNDKVYVFLRTKKPDTFILFMDDIFEDGEEDKSDVLEQYLAKVEGKPAEQILTKQMEGATVTVPLIEKEAEVKVDDGNLASLKVDLAWKEYLKGVREVPEEAIAAEMIAPFYMGLVQIDQGRIRYRCIC